MPNLESPVKSLIKLQNPSISEGFRPIGDLGSTRIFMRKLTVLILTVFVIQACSTGRKVDYFPASAPEQVSGDQTAPLVHTQPRKPASKWKNLFKSFAEFFHIKIGAARKTATPTLAVVDRSVAKEAKDHIPAVMGKDYKNTTELGEDVSKLKNSDEIQANALAQSVKPLSNQFGVEVGATLTALKQVEAEAGLKHVIPDLKSVPKFDVKNTENSAGTFLNELREKSSSGEIYTFVISGKVNDLYKAKDTAGKTLWLTGKKMMSKDGALSGYHYAVTIRKGEMEFMDQATRDDFGLFLKAYKQNHPDANLSSDLEVFRTQAGMSMQLVVFDAFLKVAMKQEKRVALLMEDAHLYLGDALKGGGYNADALDIVKRWKTKNPALTAEGEATGAHFTNLIATDDFSKLAGDLVGDTEIPVVNFPTLSLEDRSEFLEQLMLDPKNESVLEEGFTKQDFSRASGGLSAREIERLVKDAAQRGHKITANELLTRVKESLEKRFAKYKTADGKSIISVQIIDENRINAVHKANKRHLAYLDEKLEYRFKNGAFDTKNSLGPILLGGQGVGKTTIARFVAQKKKSLLITIDRYATEYHGSGAAIASDFKPVAASVENAVFFFDEFDGIPSRMNIGGVNDAIARDNNAAATIWKQTFSESPLHKTGSIFIAATANPQTVGAEYLRPGRFSPAIPLSFLTETVERRTVLDELLVKYKDKVGDVNSSIFPDEMIERLPIKDEGEMETMLKEAIARQKTPGTLVADDLESALNNKTIFRSEPLPDLIEQEFNRIFFTSEDARHLLPDYVQKIPADEFAKAKEAFQLSGGKIKPNWPLPTWMTGNGKKEFVEEVAPKLGEQSEQALPSKAKPRKKSQK